MVAQAQPIYQYRLDATDAIVSVDRWWLAFAKENSATGLNEASVIGRVVWDFISDQPTQILYKEIHDYVRSTGNSITVPFRCDSPTLQRYMELTIHKQADRGLLYESHLIRVAPQRRLAVLEPDQKRSHDFLTMCSFCKRSLIEPEGWLDIENISLKLRMYERQAVPELRYTVCPECTNRIQNNRPQQQSPD